MLFNLATIEVDFGSVLNKSLIEVLDFFIGNLGHDNSEILIQIIDYLVDGGKIFVNFIHENVLHLSVFLVLLLHVRNVVLMHFDQDVFQLVVKLIHHLDLMFVMLFDVL